MVYEGFETEYFALMKKVSAHWNKIYQDCPVTFVDMLVDSDIGAYIKLYHSLDCISSDYTKAMEDGKILADRLSQLFNCDIVCISCVDCGPDKENRALFIYVFKFKDINESIYMEDLYSFLRML